MAAHDGHPQSVAQDLGNQSDSGSQDDPRWEQLTAAVEDGTPLVLGEQLPEWTPERGDAPPAELVIAADTLRQVLVDRDLATRADPRGLDIEGAAIVGQLDLDHAAIGYPLRLINCRFTHCITLENAALHALDMHGSHLTDVLVLNGGQISGDLSMTGATVAGADTAGYSMLADGLSVDSNVLFQRGFTAAGAIRMPWAHIGGQFIMKGATLNGADTAGYSLFADGLRADSIVFLDEGFSAAGAIRMVDAHIGGQFSMKGVTLNGTDADGYSLYAEGLRADSIVFLDEGFSAAGAIRMLRAHIGGQFIMKGATLNGTDGDGNSLLANGLRADSRVYFDEGFTAAGVIGLRGADIGHLVVGNDRARLPRLGEVTGWRIGDLRGVIRTDRSAAAGWLDTQAAAQPWQELAAVYDRNGQPTDARWMRYQSAVRSTKSTKRWRWSWLGRQIYRWTTGHGYYPLAALGWLAVIFVIAWSLTAVWADEFTTATTATIREDITARAEAAATNGQAEDPPIPDPLPGRVPAAWCGDGWDVPCLNPPVYALTTAFPTAATQPWAPPADSWAPPVVFYVLRLLAWVFTAVLLAGVTGLLRKQT